MVSVHDGGLRCGYPSRPRTSVDNRPVPRTAGKNILDHTCPHMSAATVHRQTGIRAPEPHVRSPTNQLDGKNGFKEPDGARLLRLHTVEPGKTTPEKFPAYVLSVPEPADRRKRMSTERLDTFASVTSWPERTDSRNATEYVCSGSKPDNRGKRTRETIRSTFSPVAHPQAGENGLKGIH